MEKIRIKQLAAVVCLIAATCIAMAWSGESLYGCLAESGKNETGDGIVTLSGNLAQSKVYAGGDGRVSLAFAMSAAEIPGDANKKGRNVDMVVVLDRSGSMEGTKINDARKAVLNLLSELTEKDRFALVSYSNDVRKHSGLTALTGANRESMRSIVGGINAGGGTNLGAGLSEGIATLTKAENIGNVQKIILISDGLANQGTVDPISLGNMASAAVRKEFAISTAGVGADFNEQLMTAIADRGTGNYYFLENPAAFARVFRGELESGRLVAASSVEISIPLENGVSLVETTGYPIENRNGRAVFYPGDLLSGQTKRFFLTFRVPTGKTGNFEIGGITAKYVHNEKPCTASIREPFTVACVDDRREVVASIDREAWQTKVLRNDFNRLREDVASDIRQGKKQDALDRIQKYRMDNETVNSVVQSRKVKDNLEKDLGELEAQVDDTFTGSSSEVRQKQKMNSKVLQFKGYREKRW